MNNVKTSRKQCFKGKIKNAVFYIFPTSNITSLISIWKKSFKYGNWETFSLNWTDFASISLSNKNTIIL